MYDFPPPWCPDLFQRGMISQSTFPRRFRTDVYTFAKLPRCARDRRSFERTFSRCPVIRFGCFFVAAWRGVAASNRKPVPLNTNGITICKSRAGSSCREQRRFQPRRAKEPAKWLVAASLPSVNARSTERPAAFSSGYDRFCSAAAVTLKKNFDR